MLIAAALGPLAVTAVAGALASIVVVLRTAFARRSIARRA
jgi:hypothetical protein